jgi:uncharacterized membrane protein (DUF106 family)
MNECDRRADGKSFFKIVIGVCITITASWFLWISTATIDNSKEIAVSKNSAAELKETLRKFEKKQDDILLKMDRIREEQITLITLSARKEKEK